MKLPMIGGAAAIAMVLAAGSASAQQAPTGPAAPMPETASPVIPHTPHQMAPGAGRRGGPARPQADMPRADFIERGVARLTALDTNNDGTVSAEERRAGHAARRAEAADRRFSRLDANGDGAISRAEFDAAPARRGHGRHMMRGRHQGPVVIADVRARMAERFDAMDADRNGIVTAEEARTHAASKRQDRREARQLRRQGHQTVSPTPASE